MTALYQSAFLQALGWSLIDSLWQFGAMWLLYVLCTRNGKMYSASARHLFALLAIAGGTFYFFASLVFNVVAIVNGASYFSAAHLISEAVQDWRLHTPLESLMPVLAAAYGIVVSVLAARWVFRYVKNRTMLRAELRTPPDAVIALSARLKQLYGMSKKVTVWVSEKITTPLTAGVLKPVILLPVSAMTQLRPEQIEALIVHEFYHIRRNDFLINVLMSGVEALFFFNPFARLLVATVTAERENCCDDEVIALGYDPVEYAEALYAVGKNSIHRNIYAVAAAGSGSQLLLERIKRIAHRKNSGRSVMRPFVIFFLCVAGTALLHRAHLEKRQSSIVSGRTPELFFLQAMADTHIKTIQAFASERECPVNSSEQCLVDEAAPDRCLVTAIPTAPPAPPAPELPPAVETAEEPAIVRFQEISLVNRETVAAPGLVGKPKDAEAADYTNGADNYFFVSSIENVEYTYVPALTFANEVCGVDDICISADPCQPFLPGSTFYFPTHDVKNAGSRTTVDL